MLHVLLINILSSLCVALNFAETGIISQWILCRTYVVELPTPDKASVMCRPTAMSMIHLKYVFSFNWMADGLKDHFSVVDWHCKEQCVCVCVCVCVCECVCVCVCVCYCATILTNVVLGCLCSHRLEGTLFFNNNRLNLQLIQRGRVWRSVCILSDRGSSDYPDQMTSVGWFVCI